MYGDTSTYWVSCSFILFHADFNFGCGPLVQYVEVLYTAGYSELWWCGDSHNRALSIDSLLCLYMHGSDTLFVNPHRMRWQITLTQALTLKLFWIKRFPNSVPSNGHIVARFSLQTGGRTRFEWVCQILTLCWSWLVKFANDLVKQQRVH